MSVSPRYATFRDGHEEMLVGDAILASSRSGRWVDVAGQHTDALQVAPASAIETSALEEARR